LDEDHDIGANPSQARGSPASKFGAGTVASHIRSSYRVVCLDFLAAPGGKRFAFLFPPGAQVHPMMNQSPPARVLRCGRLTAPTRPSTGYQTPAQHRMI
jgi:hypothetical protein